MHRRDFLNPRHAAHAAGQLLGALDELAPEEAPPPDGITLLRLAWRAMATRWEIVVPVGTDDACEAGRDAFELLDQLEEQMTVYRDHSETCRINRTAAHRAVKVEPGLFGLLVLARQLWQETDGAFDVSAHALIKAWGFFRGPRRVPEEQERLAALACVGMGHVTLDVAKKSIHFDREGIEINLGSIGKGYALDRMAERLRTAWNLSPALLHGGGSSTYANGCPPNERRGWLLRLRHPWQPERTLAGVWLRDRAMGTSAATYRHLIHEGKRLGHVLDPRTGWPASGLASVSVVAPTAALADALSTGFYVGGIDLARRYCEAHPEVGAVLLVEGTDEVVVLGLTPEQYTLSLTSQP